jgi:hypothetical protein
VYGVYCEPSGEVIKWSLAKSGMGKYVVEANVEGTRFVWYICCDSCEPLCCIRKIS